MQKNGYRQNHQCVWYKMNCKWNDYRTTIPVDGHPVHCQCFVEEGGIAVFIVCHNHGLECVHLNARQQFESDTRAYCCGTSINTFSCKHTSIIFIASMQNIASSISTYSQANLNAHYIWQDAPNKMIVCLSSIYISIFCNRVTANPPPCQHPCNRVSIY